MFPKSLYLPGKISLKAFNKKNGLNSFFLVF